MKNLLDEQADSKKNSVEDKRLADKPKTLWSEAFKRFKRDKLAIAGGLIILLMLILALFAPIIAPYDPNVQYNNGTTAYGMPLPLNSNSKKIVATRENGDTEFTVKSSIVFTDSDNTIKFRTVGNTRVKKGELKIEFPVSAISLRDSNLSQEFKMVTPDKVNQEFNSMTLTNDKHFILGTDSSGRDSLSRLIWGARVSLLVGILSIGFATVIGVLMGLISGYFGGWIDMVIMRFTDIMMSIPDLLLVMAIVAIKGPSLWIIVTSIGIVSWTGIARLVRSQVFTVKEMEYVEAAKACGSSDMPILFKHLLPNVIAPVIVVGTMGIAGAIMTEAALSFLGFGVKVPTSSWGSMVNEGLGFFRDAAWVPIIPGVAIAVSVFAFNLFGDGVRDAIDPKLK
jgi:ABC-type dipeptide/oligopeptide/nickel transport system permease subunit